MGHAAQSTVSRDGGSCVTGLGPVCGLAQADDAEATEAHSCWLGAVWMAVSTGTGYTYGLHFPLSQDIK